MLLGFGCAPAAETVVQKSQVSLDTLFTLVEPGHLFTVDKNRFAVVYHDPAHVVLLDSAGDSTGGFGHAGRGPGEFLMPRGLVFRADTIQVLDMGNLRLVSFLDGKPVGTRPLDASLAGNMFEFLNADTLLISTQGQHEALAVRQGPDGSIVSRYGTPTSPAVTFYMMGEIAKTIAAGRIPDELKNESVPIEGCDGDVWLIEQVNGQVGRYARDGKVLSTYALPPEHVEAQKAAFFEANRHGKPNMVYPLRMVRDAVASPDGLWLSLPTPDSLPPRLLLINARAEIASDIELSSLQGNVSFVDGGDKCGDLLLYHNDSGMVLRLKR